MSLPIQIADAMVQELNAPDAGFAPVLEAARHYRPQFELGELMKRRVLVVPRSISISGVARGSNQHDVAVDVAVQQKTDVGNLAQLDTLMELVEKIADFFRLRRLKNFAGAAWVRTENSPIYSPEHLETKQIFTSVLTFTFRVVR